jgi:hypothetical protein
MNRPNVSKRPVGPVPLLHLLLFFVAALTPGLLLAQSEYEPLSLEEFRRQVDHSVETLDALDPAASAELLRLQAEWVGVTTVALPSGEIVQTQPLLGAPVESSKAEPLDVETALARLSIVRDQLNAALHDNTAVRLALLEEVLARSAFNTPESLWDRFWIWVRNLLRRVWPDSTPAGSFNPLFGGMAEGVGWAVAAVGGVLLVVLLSYWLQGLIRYFVVDAEARRRQESGEPFPLTAAEARQQAHVSARTGNYRQAVRQLYLSALLLLEEHRQIPYDRSLTNREVLTQVPVDHPLHTHLRPVVETFDEVWYGVHEPDQAAFSTYEQEIDRLAEIAQQQDEMVG